MALGVIGIFVPLMPTTVFLLIALWAFSCGSVRLEVWLYHHPRLGRSLRAWRRDRAVPRRAKVLAIATMTASFVWVTLFVAESWPLPAALLALFAAVAAYLLSRPEPAAD